MTTTSFISLSRDNLVRLFSAANFFEQNPRLANFAEPTQACLQNYHNSKKNSSCGCGGNAKILIPCFEEILTYLDSVRESNPEAVADFVRTASGTSTGNGGTSISIYYTKNNGTVSHRYIFKA